MLNQNEAELLSAYMDNELAGEELTHVQAKLAASFEWREELEKLKKSKHLTMALPRVPAPTDLLNLIESEANARINKKEFNFWGFFAFPRLNSWTWGTSMALATISVIFIGVHRMHEQSFIPLDPLIAAHARCGTNSLMGQNAVTASQHSVQLDSHETN